MSTLLVVESPNKAKCIRQYFPDFHIVATVGHFRDLPEKEIGVEAPEHKPQYVTLKGKEQVEKNLLRAAKTASQIYLALDPDREGEAIAMHVYNLLKHQHKAKMKRVTYSEVTKSAIKRAINNAGSIDWGLVRAQEARRVIDRYVGYMVSPVVTDIFRRHNKAMPFLSAGRVQSVGLKLIVERSNAINLFKPVKYYQVVASCEHDGQPFKAVWLPREDEYQYADEEPEENEPVRQENSEKKGGEKKEKIIRNQALAEEVKNRTQTLTVENIEKKAVKVAPPKPLTTSSYVQLLSKKLKLTTKEAMAVAQKLFERGLITYHRTDSPTMSADAVSTIRAYAKGQKLPIPDSPIVYKAQKSAQEGHECLRVACILRLTADDADPTINTVYKLIWHITLQSQLDQGLDQKTIIRLSNGQDAFLAEGKQIVELGWRCLDATPLLTSEAQGSHSSSSQKTETYMPHCNNDDTIAILKVEVINKFTKPLSQYNESSLVKKLDALGIGRPSTYAAVIDRIVQQHYVDRDKALTLTPTTLGQCLIDVLNDRFAFMNYAYTAELEALFDRIASRQDNMSYKDVVEAVHVGIEDDCETVLQYQFENDVENAIANLTPHSQSKRTQPKTKKQSAN